MTASLISPTGTVLLHRVRSSTDAVPDPHAKPVRVRLSVSEREALATPAELAQPEPQEHSA
jgi:hypothetical protein